MPVPGGPNNRIPPEGFHQDLPGDPRIKRRTNTLNSSLAKILHEKENRLKEDVVKFQFNSCSSRKLELNDILIKNSLMARVVANKTGAF